MPGGSHRNSLAVSGTPKVRYSLNRRPSETLIRKSLRPIDNSLRPSPNPVRKSIEIGADLRGKEWITHYDRNLHSQVTIDSRHEDYYNKHGFPVKPKYNPKSRRFDDSSETDQDYRADEFRKLTSQLNARLSVNSDESLASSRSKKGKRSRSSGPNSPQGQNPNVLNLTASMLRNGLPPGVEHSDQLGGSRTDGEGKPNCVTSLLLCLRACFCTSKPAEVSPRQVTPMDTDTEDITTATVTPNISQSTHNFYGKKRGK